MHYIKFKLYFKKFRINKEKKLLIKILYFNDIKTMPNKV